MVFKCRICEGDLQVEQDNRISTCESCGSIMSLPALNNEIRKNLYDRANHLQRNNEYDKAMDVYNKILDEDKEDAEVYWSLVLCRYGVEYVEDPRTSRL